MSTRSVSTDGQGHIAQINHTHERDDGKVETVHVDPKSGTITGKTVSDPETGKSEGYDRAGGGLGVIGYAKSK